MATSPLPTSSAPSGAPPVAPPNFYAQAASAQPAAAPGQSGSPEDTQKFRTAIEKLVTIFDKIEKLKPNGVDISKKVKAVAQSLKDLRNEVFEGEEGEGGDDTSLSSPSPAAAGNAAAGASPPPPPAGSGGPPGTGA